MIYRKERLGNLIKEELGKIIVKEVEFPDCLTTIIGVEINDNFEKAIVSFGVIPSQNSQTVQRILDKNRGHLQYLLMKKINVKPMPQIVFKVDHSS